jgi:hypothetical protein
MASSSCIYATTESSRHPGPRALFFRATGTTNRVPYERCQSRPYRRLTNSVPVKSIIGCDSKNSEAVQQREPTRRFATETLRQKKSRIFTRRSGAPNEPSVGQAGHNHVVVSAARTSWHCRRSWASPDRCCIGGAHQIDPVEGRQESPPESPRESTFRKENNQLKRGLAEKTLEVNLFQGCLARQKNDDSGVRASSRGDERARVTRIVQICGRWDP